MTRLILTDFTDVELVTGMKFVDHRELRHIIQSISVAKGFVIKYLKSESIRVLAVRGYPDICSWRLYATKMSRKDSFQIKLLNNNHTCIRDYTTTRKRICEKVLR